MGPKNKIDFKKVIELRSRHLKWVEISRIVGFTRSYLSRECSKRGIK